MDEPTLGRADASRVLAATSSSTITAFCSLPGELAARDLQDLMAYPFFSLAKSKRTEPINFCTNRLAIRVSGAAEYGIATIWDADILIWAASQIVEARDHGLPTSRLVSATPYQILRFVGRGTDNRHYDRLRDALSRLQATTILTSIRAPLGRQLHQFSWISEWKMQCDAQGRPAGISLLLSDWLYDGLVDCRQVLTLDSKYFELSGGIERWLYRVVRKHAGRQAKGWQFDLAHLHAKSGSLMRLANFAVHIRRIVAAQSLPGFELTIERGSHGQSVLRFRVASRPSLSRSIRALSRRLSTGRNL